MENQRENRSPNEASPWTNLWIIAVLCLLIAGLLLYLFWQNRYFDSKQPVDETVFGTYGDFIGGVVGSIIALYSAYLLVRTFVNQAEVNRNVIATNESVVKTNESVIKANKASVYASQLQGYQTKLQIFDNMFNSFLHSYYRALEEYIYQKSNQEITGRAAFEMIAQEFLSTDFENESDYYRRNASAISEYEDFYAKNRTYLSVHFRTLYLLLNLIAKSDLQESDKALYAKLVRGQLSEKEILLIRYNAGSSSGKRMQEYCNRFNITKHISTMQLLEFRKYRVLLAQKSQEDRTLNFDELMNGLDTIFVNLRKAIKQLLDDNEEKSDNEIGLGKNYSAQLELAEDGKAFTFTFIKEATERRGGGYRLPSAEKALDCFDVSQISDLFRDFLSDLFYISNFMMYNFNGDENENKNVLSGEVLSNSPTGFKCKYRIVKTKRLVLSYFQAIERDRDDEIVEIV